MPKRNTKPTEVTIPTSSTNANLVRISEIARAAMRRDEKEKEAFLESQFASTTGLKVWTDACHLAETTLTGSKRSKAYIIADSDYKDAVSKSWLNYQRARYHASQEFEKLRDSIQRQK
jgi:hypothetical protein